MDDKEHKFSNGMAFQKVKNCYFKMTWTKPGNQVFQNKLACTCNITFPFKEDHE